MEKQEWQIYLNIDGEFSSYVHIWADSVIQSGEARIIADGVMIDFENEILGLSEMQQLVA